MKSALGCFVFLALILLLRCANWGDVFLAGEIYFADGDCYARMTRAREVFGSPGRVVKHHAFENHPEGTSPHATAPLDYLVAGLAWGLRPWSARPLDVAGAFVGPLASLLGGWFLWLWAGRLRLPGRPAMLLLYAASPILVHGGMLGRPDHQLLLLPLMAVAFGSEVALARGGGPRWGACAGAAWGLGLWVSLYEPPLLLAGASLLGGAATGRRFFSSARLVEWVAIAAVAGIALALEGWRFEMPGGELFGRWKPEIGELRAVPLGSGIWWAWCGWGGLLVLAGLAARREGWPALAGLCGLVALTAWQARWGYFLALAAAMAIPFAAASAGAGWRRWLCAALWCAGLWPVAAEWDRALYGGERERGLRRQENIALRAASDAIAENGGGPILAPWWLSPPLAYWTGSPAVAGSSHASLPGIADAAKFWMAATEEEAFAVVARREVRWVVADDPARVLPGAAALLGAGPVAPAPWPMGRILYERPSQGPAWLAPVEAGPRFKVFRVE